MAGRSQAQTQVLHLNAAGSLLPKIKVGFQETRQQASKILKRWLSHLLWFLVL
jgi:hypothetical protein